MSSLKTSNAPSRGSFGNGSRAFEEKCPPCGRNRRFVFEITLQDLIGDIAVKSNLEEMKLKSEIGKKKDLKLIYCRDVAAADINNNPIQMISVNWLDPNDSKHEAPFTLESVEKVELH